jgi:hypothetical protein
MVMNEENGAVRGIRTFELFGIVNCRTKVVINSELPK